MPDPAPLYEVWSTCGSGFAIADASTTTSDNLFVRGDFDSYALKLSLHHEDISNLVITLMNPFYPQRNKALLKNVQATSDLNVTVMWRFTSDSETTVAQAAGCGVGSVPTSGTCKNSVLIALACLKAVLTAAFRGFCTTHCIGLHWLRLLSTKTGSLWARILET